MKAKSYLQNAVLLTAAGLLLRFAGMFLRVYTAGQLGSEGMGLYQLAFTAYGVFAAVANTGVSVAAARLTAEEMGRGRPDAMLGAMKRVLWLSGWLGALAGLLQAAGAGLMAEYWLGDGRAAFSLWVLAPTLPFIGVSAALRGCFLALREVGPNIRAQLAEQLVRIGFVFWLLPRALGGGLGWACAAAAAGNLVSEAVSCLLMVGAWQKQKKAWPLAKPQKPPALGRRVWEIMAPVEGSGIVRNVLKAAENALIPACLLGLLGKEGALAAYGALKGMAMPLLMFPFSFLGALATLLMPEITQAQVQGHTAALRRLIDRMMLLTGSVSVLAGGLFFLHGEQLALLLYGDPEAGRYIRLLGPVMPFVYMESMVDGVLKGLDQQLASFRYNVWDSLLRIGAMLVLLPRFGMDGLLGIMAVSNLFVCLLNCRRMLQVSGLRASWLRWFAGPVVLLVPGALAGRAVAGWLGSAWGGVLAGGGITAGVYLLLWSFGEAGRMFRTLVKRKAEPDAGCRS